MSGPIVRKYGFPNFDKIFGERGLEHGVDEAEATSSAAGNAPGAGGTPANAGIPEKAAKPGEDDKPSR